MKPSEEVLFDISGGVATLTLNKVTRHNALSLAMLHGIDSILEQVENDDNVRILVFRSASPRFFSSGADINDWGQIDAEGMGSRFIRTGNRVFRRVTELDIPTLAVLGGDALGGGLELALACDFRYALQSAQVGFPEASVGAIPGWMGCQRLFELVGPNRAKQLILLGESISATQAAEWGIINAALPEDQLEAHVSHVCELLEKRSAVSISVAKRLLRLVASGQTDIAHEFAASVCKATPDAAEGVAAFREKRHAKFAR
jgi:enoyl-CoA hydratase